MSQIIGFIEEIMAIQFVDIIIAIGIILFFRIFSSSFSYIIIRMFKIKDNKAKKIKQSAFYSPLKVFFIILGFYLAIVFLKKPLDISNEVMIIAYRAFIIITTIAFAKGLAASFTPNLHYIRKWKKRQIQM